MKRVVDKEQVESLLPNGCDGGFHIAEGKEYWFCARCTARGPWECQDLPEQTALRRRDARREEDSENFLGN